MLKCVFQKLYLGIKIMCCNLPQQRPLHRCISKGNDQSSDRLGKNCSRGVPLTRVSISLPGSREPPAAQSPVTLAEPPSVCRVLPPIRHPVNTMPQTLSEVVLLTTMSKLFCNLLVNDLEFQPLFNKSPIHPTLEQQFCPPKGHFLFSVVLKYSYKKNQNQN